MRKDATIRLDGEDVIALERGLGARDVEEAFRLLKQRVENVRRSQFIA